jgi:hypothetical protein
VGEKRVSPRIAFPDLLCHLTYSVRIALTCQVVSPTEPRATGPRRSSYKVRVPPLRPNEEWARQTLESALGVPVEQNDDSTQPAMHDLSILSPSGSRGAVEVKGAIDEASTELWNIAYRDGRWEEPGLAGGWHVYVDPTRRSPESKLRRDLPAFLRELETAQIPHYSAGVAPHVESLAQRLGVVRARQGGTDFPGSIYVSPELPAEQWVGYASNTADAVATWVSDFLHDDAMANLRQKLASSAADERHAFVIVGTFSGVPLAITDLLMRDDAPLPTESPQLPPEVTDVWVASAWAAGHGLRWSATSGWRTFAKAQLRPVDSTSEAEARSEPPR